MLPFIGSSKLSLITFKGAFLGCFLLFVAQVCLAKPEQAFVPDMPNNWDDVQVSLLTVGRGDVVYALYGHTILRLIDPSHNLDVGFNWGIFDFHDPSFAFKFYRGDLRYLMAITETPALLDHYRFNERRSVTEDVVRLTTLQKKVLLKRLIWNSQPENIPYNYDQFKDNCATKPRDHLNEALGGKIKDTFDHGFANESFRDWIRWGASLSPWIYLGLDQVTNSFLDQRVTPWQNMFIPHALRSYLKEMPAFDDQGKEIAGQTLLYNTATLVDIKEPPVGLNPYMLVTILLGIPIIGLAVLSLGAHSPAVPVALGGICVIWGTWSSLWGIIFVCNWLLSGYPPLKASAGLLIYNPVDVFFVMTGFKLFGVGRTALSHSPWKRRSILLLLQIIAFSHVVGFIGALVAWGFGLIKQDMLPMLSSGGVLSLVVAGAVIVGGDRCWQSVFK